MKWQLIDIVEATGGRLVCETGPRSFNGIGIDSRTISTGDLFVAIRGENHDGHKFVPQVVDMGVRGLVVHEEDPMALDKAVWEKKGVTCIAVRDTIRALGAMAAMRRSRVTIPVVAITGSNGKTTTRQMTALVMAQRFNTLATEGNLNNEIGLPLTLFRLTGEHGAAVLELGMNHAGELDRLGAICRPTIGLITNAGPAHLEFLGSVEAVARAKGELLDHVDAGGTAVLNKDDPYVAALADRVACNVLFFGTSPQCDVRAESIHETAAGLRFDLILPVDRTAVVLHSPGRFMVANALAAAAAGYRAGLDIQEIRAGLEAFKPVKGRLNVISTDNGVNIVDDTYNANPASMAAAIQTLDSLAGTGRRFIVLGDMLELGVKSPELHFQVGVAAGGVHAEKIYAFGDYSQDVISGARQAGMSQNQLAAAAKEDIAADLTRRLKKGDWVLVKGSRGMAMETVVSKILEWARAGSGGDQISDT